MDFEQKEREGTENAESLHFGVGIVLPLRHGDRDWDRPKSAFGESPALLKNPRIGANTGFFEMLRNLQAGSLHVPGMAKGREETRLGSRGEYTVLAWVMNCTAVLRALK